MHPNLRRAQLRHLMHTCLIASFVTPLLVQAQAADDPEVEEVLVTGSYIRNSAFAQNSPVATINQDDLYQSGAPSMANYIRDLSFT
jgi:outer membrane cobalamin receptor